MLLFYRELNILLSISHVKDAVHSIWSSKLVTNEIQFQVAVCEGIMQLTRLRNKAYVPVYECTCICMVRVYSHVFDCLRLTSWTSHMAPQFIHFQWKMHLLSKSINPAKHILKIKQYSLTDSSPTIEHVLRGACRPLWKGFFFCMNPVELMIYLPPQWIHKVFVMSVSAWDQDEKTAGQCQM